MNQKMNMKLFYIELVINIFLIERIYLEFKRSELIFIFLSWHEITVLSCGKNKKIVVKTFTL